MRKLGLILFGALALSSCETSPELAYCRSLGTGIGSPSFEACRTYYFQQEAAFDQDRAFCSAQADQTYPQSLYSGWGTAIVHGGMYGGQWHGAQQIETPPNYQQNAQLDALRMRIIEPCMQSRGWVSGTNWQAGHRAPVPVGTMPAPASLPWAK